jgi:hypothetical protein
MCDSLTLTSTNADPGGASCLACLTASRPGGDPSTPQTIFVKTDAGVT